jgi:hypothetical protein
MRQSVRELKAAASYWEVVVTTISSPCLFVDFVVVAKEKGWETMGENFCSGYRGGVNSSIRSSSNLTLKLTLFASLLLNLGNLLALKTGRLNFHA